MQMHGHELHLPLHLDAHLHCVYPGCDGPTERGEACCVCLSASSCVCRVVWLCLQVCVLLVPATRNVAPNPGEIIGQTVARRLSVGAAGEGVREGW